MYIYHLSISSVAGGVGRFSDACGLPCDTYIYICMYIYHLSISSVAGGVSRFSDACGLPRDGVKQRVVEVVGVGVMHRRVPSKEGRV